MGEKSGKGLSPLPRKLLDFFLPRNGAFCAHSDTFDTFGQFITPVIRIKPVKSSDVVSKPCNVVIILRIRNSFMTSANYFGN